MCVREREIERRERETDQTEFQECLFAVSTLLHQLTSLLKDWK